MNPQTSLPFASLRPSSLALAGILCLTVGNLAGATPLAGWMHTGSMAVLTTPEGADLPAGAVVEDFPLLVRLDRDWFDFAQAKADGSDVRFTWEEDADPLSLQVDHWDAASGQAAFWVRVPRIKGDSRHALRMHWGKSDAPPVSDARAVFDGYVGVWHLGESTQDATGAIPTKDQGTTVCAGVIGGGRHFSGGTGIAADKLNAFPSVDAPHTTEAWFRPEEFNRNLLGWGNETKQGKVVMQYRSAQELRMDCWFSVGSISGHAPLPLREWNHVAFTCERESARIYLNGVLAGQSNGRGTPQNILSPAGIWIGSWRGGDGFTGDIDEVRVCKGVRSAEWIRLQYENQKPFQSVVGPLVRPGTGGLAVTPAEAEIPEGGRARFNVRAEGALKLSWSVVSGGREEVVAVDRFSHEFAAGRVSGNTMVILRLKAVYPTGVTTRDIPLRIRELIPDPEFILEAPSSWDGRTPFEIMPRISNQTQSGGAGAGGLRMEWKAGPAAVTKDEIPGGLRLLAAQRDGPLEVTATLSNGGAPVSRKVTVNVRQPASHPWVERGPEPREKPEEGQFYARDDRGEGTLHYNGKLAKPAAEVFLKVFADGKPFASAKARPGPDGGYALSARLKPGLVTYGVEFGTLEDGLETVLDRVSDLVCGDAFLIDGQSNAECLDLPSERPGPRDPSPWIRTYGGPQGRDNGAAFFKQNWSHVTEGSPRPNLWRRAVWAPKDPEYPSWIGWWGMELGRRLVASRQVPVFILNGALGGTRVDQHQRNPGNPADLETLYGKQLWRLRQARLTHGIRGIIWHQGENDQPAANPRGRPGHEVYQDYFLEMAAGWQRDFPNARHYFMFQIWPNSCGMGGDKGDGDLLRERQRTLPDRFSNLSILSTLGIRPPGGCHYPREGYDEFARMLQPLIERDVHGVKPASPVTPPNLRRATYAGPARDSLVLEFDQKVAWRDALADQFYLDGKPGQIAGGSVSGNTLTLRLKTASSAKTITYLKESRWSQDNLLTGAENGLAALTFCEVPIDSKSN